MTTENISWSPRKNVADLGGGWTCDLLVSSRMAHPNEPPRLAYEGLFDIPVLTFFLVQNDGIFSYLGYEIFMEHIK